jgi:hypothetical protein
MQRDFNAMFFASSKRSKARARLRAHGNRHYRRRDAMACPIERHARAQQMGDLLGSNEA